MRMVPYLSTVSVAVAPESEGQVEVSFREARPSDEPLINKAFLMGMRDNPYTKGMPNDVYFGLARQVWDGIQREMETTVAHVPGEPGEVMGYVTHGKDDRGTTVVAWLYVSGPWRRMRVGRRLLERVGAVPHVKFAVLLANPRALAWFRAANFQPAFTPFVTWRWLRQEAA
jgi:ribosomal protein S18 acetylase RimI-like enzyme